ncbi:MAG: DUF2269 domain-containing protein [Gammaproteobacteria bacterium]|nr:DUF2269 domain-containing protein [Gammaproteobacteria bacterium]
MSYLTLKYLHILSMVLLFGTGLGSAFYKWMADRSRNIEHIRITNQNVVLADWVFTTPTVIFQPISGIWMAYLANITLSTFWLTASLVLYVLAGACWLRVVWLQIRMSTLSNLAAQNHTELNDQYWRYAKMWFWLGIPAFSAMVLVVLLMVFKPV